MKQVTSRRGRSDIHSVRFGYIHISSFWVQRFQPHSGISKFQFGFGSLRVRITHLNYFLKFKFIICLKFVKIYKQNNILQINVNSICQMT